MEKICRMIENKTAMEWLSGESPVRTQRSLAVTVTMDSAQGRANPIPPPTTTGDKRFDYLLWTAGPSQ